MVKPIYTIFNFKDRGCLSKKHPVVFGRWIAPALSQHHGVVTQSLKPESESQGTISKPSDLLLAHHFGKRLQFSDLLTQPNQRLIRYRVML
jgi:hypothetical protein